MGTFAIYHRNSCGPVRAELDAIKVITDNVAEAISWARDPDERMRAFVVLPKQVAALQAIAAAISQQASALDAEGQEAIDEIVEGSRKLAELVQRHLEPSESEN
jgi:hypothetical protein